MILKANLHLHTKDDPEDLIPYTFETAIKEAAKLGFQVIAITCHNSFVFHEKYRIFADENNILLIPGIEKTIQKKHVLILNCDKNAENIKNFKELETYKKTNPDIFIIAPHPFFYGNTALKKKLLQNIRIFDAIEHSWFYSKKFNRNTKGSETARKFNLPFIATSDTHNLFFLDTNYALIEAEEKTIPAILKAIHDREFKNVTAPRNFWKEMIFITLYEDLISRIKKILIKFHILSSELKKDLAFSADQEFPLPDQEQ